MSSVGWGAQPWVLSAAVGAACWTTAAPGSILEGKATIPPHLQAGSCPASGGPKARTGGATGAWLKVSTVQLLCTRQVQSWGWKIPSEMLQLIHGLKAVPTKDPGAQWARAKPQLSQGTHAAASMAVCKPAANYECPQLLSTLEELPLQDKHPAPPSPPGATQPANSQNTRLEGTSTILCSHL